MAAPSGRGSERRYRLTGIGAFEALFREGRRREGERLQIVFMPARGVPGRTGFVIGKKALPRAVDRNRLRRMLRESLRRNRPALAPYDLIVRLKRGCPPAAFSEVRSEAERLLRTLPPASGKP